MLLLGERFSPPKAPARCETAHGLNMSATFMFPGVQFCLTPACGLTKMLQCQPAQLPTDVL